jgi:hypothetical protein
MNTQTDISHGAEAAQVTSSRSVYGSVHLLVQPKKQLRFPKEHMPHGGWRKYPPQHEI